MKKLFQKIFLMISVFFPATLFAADAGNTAWQFNIAPYVWETNMNGRVVNGPFITHVSDSFFEILQDLDFGAMLWVDAHKGPMGFFANGLYTVLTDHKRIRRTDAKIKTYFGIFSGGISYIVLQQQFANPLLHDQSQLQLEPYAGFRTTMNDVRLTIANFRVKNNQQWTDAILGLRTSLDLTRRWTTELAGDIGGKNSAQKSFNIVGLIGYHPENCHLRNTTFYLGYRYLYEHYETGSGFKKFDWNMRIFGPVLGVNFNF